MKKLLLIAFVAFFVNAKAQFTLEHTYDSAATFNTNLGGLQGHGQLMIIKFEASGEQYVKISSWAKTIDIYNLNHSLVQTISLAAMPIDVNAGLGDVLYLSEHLFNYDSKKEFMYVHAFTVSGNINYATSIYNEDGLMLFTDTAWPGIKMNVPLQQYPIYNTSQGTKMILSKITGGQAHVWGLAGTLSTAIQSSSTSLLSASSIVSNPYPNPTNNTTTIDYALPPGTNQGEIVFYDLQGNEIKRFKVDQTFNSLLISTSDIAAGTYYYQLQTSGNSSAGKKLVVIK